MDSGEHLNMNFPTNPSNDDLHVVNEAEYKYSTSLKAWIQLTHGSSTGEVNDPLGTIICSTLTEAEFITAVGPTEAGNWKILQGGSILGSDFAQLTGLDFAPDARGGFMRMGDFSGVSAIGSFQDSWTKLPINPFVIDLQGDHTHGPYMYLGDQGGSSFDNKIAIQGAEFGSKTKSYQRKNRDGQDYIQAGGVHTHTIEGGDAETKPVSLSVNYFLRINK